MKKTILIIGGSRGIGAALTKQLLEEHLVIMASRTPASFTHPHLTWLPFDAETDDLSARELPAALDGFVYLPGSINLKPFKLLKENDFTQDLQVNFLGAVRTLKEVLPRLNPGASVLFFSTVATHIGMPFHSSISASKGALEGLSRSLAAEYAPKIRFNCIAPSLTQTPLAEKFLNSPVKLEKMAERHPMKSIGNPEDIAALAVFLLSDKSSWITGQTFHADGGLSTLNLS